MNIIEAISKRIKYYLDMKGWSVYKLSRETGLSPNGIQVILQNETHNINYVMLKFYYHKILLNSCEFVCF